MTGLSDCTLFSLVVRGAAYLRGIHVLVWVSNVCPHVLPSNILLSSEYPYPQPLSSYILLPPIQIIGRFSFFRNLVFAMHLDICYVYIDSKSYESINVKTSYNLGQREYINLNFQISHLKECIPLLPLI